MASSSVTTKRGRGRPAPSRLPILDREALLQALDARDILVKKAHVDGFYQALHRQHYPELNDFVKQYYQHELEATGAVDPSLLQLLPDSRNPPAAAAQEDQTPVVLPLKNSITNRKNKNRINLPKHFLQFLADPDCGFVTVTSKVALVKTSGDGSTTKLAVQLHDGQLVESVLMRYGPKMDGKKVEKCGRASLCLSSQVGCAMACNFCATGMMGLTGDLRYAEILEQVIHAERILAKEAMERRVLRGQGTNTNNSKGKSQKQHLRKDNTDLDVVRNIVFMGTSFLWRWLQRC